MKCVIHFLFVFVLFTSLAFTQAIDLPSFPEIVLDQRHHIDSLGDYRNQFYNNGRKKIEYESMSDSTFFRRDYNVRGRLVKEAEIAKCLRIDTVVLRDGSFDLRVNRYTRAGDCLCGSYIEYEESSSGNRLTKYKGILTTIGWVKTLLQ